MVNKQPILSICIPTYNRPDALKQCLYSIFCNSFYDEDLVEVVVSDNDTPNDLVDNVIKKYKGKKNFIYNKNKTNIGGEANFIKVLKLAHGKLLKLNNDYSIFTEAGLNYLLNACIDFMDTKPMLFFNNLGGNCSYIKFNSLDDIIYHENWTMTWIGCYGFWKEDFDNLPNKDRAQKLMFQQIDWFLRIFENKDYGVICEACFTTRFKFNEKQGGYDFINVHTTNFFYMFREVVRDRRLSKKTYNRLKKDVLYNMLEWIGKLNILHDKNYSYSSSSPCTILWKNYYMNWWFIPCVINFFLKKVVSYLK